MGRLLALGCLLIGLLASPSWAQDAPAPLTVHGGQREPEAHPGDRERVTLRERWRTSTSRGLQGDSAPPLVVESEKVVSAVFVEEVLEVERGEATRLALTFEAWRWTRGERAHDDLQGQRVVLGRGERGFELQGDVPELSPPARRFLERQAARLARPLVSDVVPREVLRPGDRWQVDPALVAPHLLEDAALDAQRSGAEAWLLRLEAQGGGPRGAVRLEARLQLATLPGTDVQVREGGLWQVRAELDWPLEQPRRLASLRERARFEGTGRGRRPDGRGYELSVRAEGEVELTVEPMADSAEPGGSR